MRMPSRAATKDDIDRVVEYQTLACRDDRSDRYTPGMKTAVSVPDDIFEGAERLARREGRSRSEVYSAALREYVSRHEPDEIVDALDRVVAEVGETIDPFVAAASRRTLETTDW
jgi:hypothetical protein